MGVKSLVYFEVGLDARVDHRPRRREHVAAGRGVQRRSLDARYVTAATYTDAAAAQSATQFILHIIPRTFADAFSGDGDMLQVLLIAVLFGYALTRLGRRGEAVHQVLTQVSHVFFGMMNVVMKLAPFGAGAAMAFTLGAYGLAALMPLGWLLVGYYLTCLFLSLAFSAALPHGPGSACWRFILYMKDEVLTVLGTRRRNRRSCR